MRTRGECGGGRGEVVGGGTVERSRGVCGGGGGGRGDRGNGGTDISQLRGWRERSGEGKV